MTEKDIILALRGNHKSVNFNFRKLQKVSSEICRLPNLETLSLKGNQLIDLPPELSCLRKLESINLGQNAFEELPPVLSQINQLKSLHLFGNRISYLAPKCLCAFRNVTLMNLNSNHIQKLPAEICRMSNLETLCLDNNQLSSIPVELCHLTNLVNLRVAVNLLTSLPESIAFLRNLKMLDVHKNMLTILPEGLTKCKSLEVLDVSANQLTSFPSKLDALRLKEFYCEQNRLLKNIPVESIKNEVALSLKELCNRFILCSLRDPASPFLDVLGSSALLQNLMVESHDCAICQMPFVTTWLECVRFIDCKKAFSCKYSVKSIPLRARVCSYKCFNEENHDFLGVADLTDELGS